MAQSGLPGFDAAGWFGFFARAVTPAEIVNRLNAEARVVIEMPDVRSAFSPPGTPRG